MWNQNFMFTQDGTTPVEKTENELFHDIPQALDSAALNGERYISVWVQGEEEKGRPVAQVGFVGVAGETGNASGVHLHQDLWCNGERIDFLKYFK